ncbi:rhodanese-like domain-containing protein [Sedimenticola sp.]|uniref:rhodanese-like domain-containing protein n=1 Tax=Sedimenticola sp. TaxID=1940285 RepID=UPI003D0D862B
MIQKISREEILENLDNNRPMTLVEALPLQYFEDQHLPGAININFDEIEQLAPKVLPDKEALIVVYCANTPCQNSTKAAFKLTTLGYTHVREYAEGKEDWVNAGLTTVSSKAAA